MTFNKASFRQRLRCERRGWIDRRRASGDPDPHTAPDAPPIWLANHCDTCPWHAACKERAHATHALTLLPGLQYDSWAHLTEAGYTSMTQIVDAAPSDLMRFRKIGRVTAHKFVQAARSFVEGRAIWMRSLEQAARVPGIYLDIETEWDIAKPWAFGWMDPDEHLSMLIVRRPDALRDAGPPHQLPNDIRINLVPDAVRAWEVIAQAADNGPAGMDGPIYHWGGYDKQVMLATASLGVQAWLSPRMIDLNAVFRRTVIVPTGSTSMKAIAPYLGCPYPDETDAMIAWQLYRRWRARSVSEASDADFAPACGYLRADVVGLTRAWHFLVNGSPVNASPINGSPT